MRTLNKDLVQKIEAWLAPLPQKLQDLAWEAIYTSAKAGMDFNPHANDLSELLIWHLSPVGNFFWEALHETTEHVWNQNMEELQKPQKTFFRWIPQMIQEDLAA